MSKEILTNFKGIDEISAFYLLNLTFEMKNSEEKANFVWN